MRLVALLMPLMAHFLIHHGSVKLYFGQWFLGNIDACNALRYNSNMIKTFRHKSLSKLFFKGDTKGLPFNLLSRIERRLSALNAAKVPQDLKLPGFNFHALSGKPKRYTIHVSGNWCITFGWDDGAIDVDLEDYH